MRSSVSIHEKKDFLRFFLENYQLKHRECSWILKYVLNSDERIDQVKFVDNIDNCPFAVEISTKCVETEPFRFINNFQEMLDAEKAFHEIRANKAKQLIILLQFDNKENCEKYISVVESNPFHSKDISDPEMIQLEAETIIQKSIIDFQKTKLQVEIDHAIDNGDRTSFYILSQRLNELLVYSDQVS